LSQIQIWNKESDACIRTALSFNKLIKYDENKQAPCSISIYKTGLYSNSFAIRNSSFVIRN